ncbi:MAG: hypothetical protein WDN69_23920 [Aliidongia sp.]
MIHQIGLSVLAEMTRETATSRMFAEIASLMLAARLAHDYTGGSFIGSGAGPASRLDNARLRRVLDHIDRHLEEDITGRRPGRSGQSQRFPLYAHVHRGGRHAALPLCQPAAPRKCDGHAGGRQAPFERRSRTARASRPRQASPVPSAAPPA